MSSTPFTLKSSTFTSGHVMTLITMKSWRETKPGGGPRIQWRRSNPHHPPLLCRDHGPCNRRRRQHHFDDGKSKLLIAIAAYEDLQSLDAAECNRAIIRGMNSSVIPEDHLESSRWIHWLCVFCTAKIDVSLLSAEECIEFPPSQSFWLIQRFC